MIHVQLADCDIVMKGGVTSGVVYPAAVAALAKRFRFRSIGGTSAGAIAAVVTAAAEFARTVENGSRGFDRLAQIPANLRQGKLLLRLFTPQFAMAPLFHTLVVAFSARPWWSKIPALLITLSAYFVLPALAVLAVASLLPYQRDLWQHPGTIAFEVIVLAAVHVFAVFAWLLRANNYGLTRAGKLVTWLDGVIDEIAFGPDHTGAPLTFGNLWDPHNANHVWPQPSASARERLTAAAQRVIDLQMMTTCISLGRPYRIPFDTNIFWFDPRQMRRYFPERIVAHMIANARISTNAQNFLPLIAFPEAHNVPVIVAARMSLSFPLLISAVPLLAVDYNDRPEADADHPLRPKQCWFSDGGLSSNFPVHFFDSPLPTRPTFGIDLQPFDNRHVYNANDQTQNVSMITNMGDDIIPPSSFSKGSVTGFLSAIVGTMQNWADAAQSRLPGYRDRIVRVLLRPNEGGLNLDMSTKLLTALEQRGRAAGELLLARFDPDDTSTAGGWQSHRRVRYLTIMDMFQRFIGGYANAWNATPAEGPTYPALVAQLDQSGPYQHSSEFAAQAAPAGNRIAGLDRSWTTEHADFIDGAPRPSAELRVRPPV